jgi:uncharacterized protein (TIGR00251 family)
VVTRASDGEAAELAVRLQPRARRTEIVGERDGALVIRVVEPPVEGKANEALRKLIAKRAGVARGRVSIVRGAASRKKLVRVEGVGAEKLRRSLLPAGPVRQTSPASGGRDRVPRRSP